MIELSNIWDSAAIGVRWIDVLIFHAPWLVISIWQCRYRKGYGGLRPNQKPQQINIAATL